MFLGETIESLEENHPKGAQVSLNNFDYQGKFITHLKWTTTTFPGDEFYGISRDCVMPKSIGRKMHPE